jgi:1,4-alpha-glucan branching enzyme
MFSLFEEAKKSSPKTALQKRILAQMERELVLYQSSDWAFMIHNNSAEDYARERLADHERDFMKLSAMFNGEFEDESLLSEMESRDNIFPWIGKDH